MPKQKHETPLGDPNEKPMQQPDTETEEQTTSAAGTKETKQKQPAGKKPKETGAGVEARLAAAEQQASDAEGKLDEVKESLLRTAAEYENYRKRSQKENEMAFSHGVSHAVCELLPILDTLDAAAVAQTTDEEYKKGVLLTLDKCKEVFKKLGIAEIEALSQPFDPELHNAVMQEPAEGAESGTITRVMQKGYTLHGKVIRHAMVAVAP